MPDNKNTILVETPDLGIITLTVTDDQVDKIITKGAETLNETFPTRFKRKLKYGTKKVEGGIVDNETNWSDIFPNVDNDELNTLIEEVMAEEKKIRDFSEAVAILIAVGAAGALGGASAGKINGMKLLEAMGPYFEGQGVDTSIFEIIEDEEKKEEKPSGENNEDKKKESKPSTIENIISSVENIANVVKTVGQLGKIVRK